MKKKVEAEEVDFEATPEEVIKPITPVVLEFNREDLNMLRDKVNELVNHTNEKTH